MTGDETLEEFIERTFVEMMLGSAQGANLVGIVNRAGIEISYPEPPLWTCRRGVWRQW